MNKRIYILICLFAVVFCSTGAYASKPLFGIVGVESLSPRGERIALMLEGHIQNIVHTSGVFDMVNRDLMKDQLKKFNCTDEKCILRFARDAGIDVIVQGEVSEQGSKAVITLVARGTDIPFDGKIIYSFKVEIPIYRKYAAAEYSYICEEQAGYFVSSFFKYYQLPVFLKMKDNGSLGLNEDIHGSYPLYRITGDNFKDRPRLFAEVGKITIDSGSVASVQKKTLPLAGDFVLLTYKKKADFFNNFYYGRKKEIVFKESTYKDVLYMLLFTGPASAVMPVVSPLFGYYRNSDWSGLTMWAFNVAPYLYLEINGFVNYPDQFRDKKKNIPRRVMTQWHFAFYFAFAGGASLFIDSFAQGFLQSSSQYLSKSPFMGNRLAAAYLALVSGGAGHFYRGSRFWGYVYFHVNNALLYLIINEFSPGERYDVAKGKYVKERINETRGYTYVGIFCAVKIVEIIHAVLLKDKIRNGVILDESSSLEPVFYSLEDSPFNIGLRYNYRF